MDKEQPKAFFNQEDDDSRMVYLIACGVLDRERITNAIGDDAKLKNLVSCGVFDEERIAKAQLEFDWVNYHTLDLQVDQAVNKKLTHKDGNNHVNITIAIMSSAFYHTNMVFTL